MSTGIILPKGWSKSGEYWILVKSTLKLSTGKNPITLIDHTACKVWFDLSSVTLNEYDEPIVNCIDLDQLSVVTSNLRYPGTLP